MVNFKRKQQRNVRSGSLLASVPHSHTLRTQKQVLNENVSNSIFDNYTSMQDSDFGTEGGNLNDDSKKSRKSIMLDNNSDINKPRKPNQPPLSRIDLSLLEAEFGDGQKGSVISPLIKLFRKNLDRQKKKQEQNKGIDELSNNLTSGHLAQNIKSQEKNASKTGFADDMYFKLKLHQISAIKEKRESLNPSPELKVKSSPSLKLPQKVNYKVIPQMYYRIIHNFSKLIKS